MRQLTRSMIRFSWAMPLLGINQVTNLVTPGEAGRSLESAAETFDALSDVAYRQMSPRLRELYDQGNRLQRRSLDTMLGAINRSSRQAEEACCGDSR